METPKPTKKAEKGPGDYNRLQDWMCSIGEPWSSLIVSGILAALVVFTLIFMRDVLHLWKYVPVIPKP